MTIYAEKLLSPDGWLYDQVVGIKDGVIASVRPGKTGDRRAEILAPGLLDLHCHGGLGFDPFTLSFEKLRVFLDGLLSHGVTDVLLTLFTNETIATRDALRFIQDAMRLQSEKKLGGTCILGVHMEGPFLSPLRPGAMTPERMARPDPDIFLKNYGDFLNIIKMVTLAPEEDNDFALIKWLIGRGIKVQAGHSDATFEQAEAAFAAGVTSLCHTFNALRPIHHREPGIITAALLDDNVYCEAICDLVHLHPGTLKLIYKCKGARRMAAISDATMTTALADGVYADAGAKYDITVADGVNRTPTGALCGGGIFLDGAVRKLISIGITAEDALTMASSTPAARLALPDVGVIRPGGAARLVAFDGDYKPVFTTVETDM